VKLLRKSDRGRGPGLLGARKISGGHESQPSNYITCSQAPSARLARELLASSAGVEVETERRWRRAGWYPPGTRRTAVPSSATLETPTDRAQANGSAWAPSGPGMPDRIGALTVPQ
jgi:hypothetical protein